MTYSIIGSGLHHCGHVVWPFSYPYHLSEFQPSEHSHLRELESLRSLDGTARYLSNSARGERGNDGWLPTTRKVPPIMFTVLTPWNILVDEAATCGGCISGAG